MGTGRLCHLVVYQALGRRVEFFAQSLTQACVRRTSSPDEMLDARPTCNGQSIERPYAKNEIRDEQEELPMILHADVVENPSCLYISRETFYTKLSTTYGSDCNIVVTLSKFDATRQHEDTY